MGVKDRIYRTALAVYFKCERIPLLSSINLAGYRLLANLSNPNARGGRYDKKAVLHPEHTVREVSKLRLAMIADTMTYDCFSSTCDCIALTAKDWQRQMLEFQPHIFFCESAWLGSKENGFCWRGQLYDNKTVFFNNRRTVEQILSFCRRNEIPTVFFNKEDPTSFDDPYHCFTPLALQFDHIYTTAEECVLKYLSLGAKHCACMQMGVSLSLYNPLRKEGASGSGAVFAGSWFAEYAERCADMRALFEQMKQSDIPLTIYDRNYGGSNPQKQFPKEYEKQIRPSIPFDRLGEELKRYEYALNINTVKGSKTMFARRVFEVMALGLYVISNESAGLRALFGEDIRFTGEELPDEVARRASIERNLSYVIRNHSYRSRLLTIAKDVGITVERTAPVIGKPGDADCDLIATGDAAAEWLTDAALHFEYLPQGVGISLSGGGVPYVIRARQPGEAVLYRASEGEPERVISLG